MKISRRKQPWKGKRMSGNKTLTLGSLFDGSGSFPFGGILIFKCQDKVSSGKQYMSHVFIVNTAVETGFYPKDLFVLLAKNRLVADWQARNQKHSRKFHCYFIVFQKCGTRIDYGGRPNDPEDKTVQLH